MVITAKSSTALRAVPLSLILVSLQAPLGAQKIASGYSEDHLLSTLKNYAFAVQERDERDSLAGQPTHEELIREVLGEELEAAGFARVAENPDFLVAFYTHRQLKTTYRSLGRAAPRQFSSDHYEVGNLYVDFVVFPSQEAAWSGVASKALRNTQPEKLVRNACRKLIEQFRKDALRQQKEQSKKK